jgi:hypothetical protein
VRLKKRSCEHLMVDSWHVPSQEARELVRHRDRGPYGWREQLRAEMTGELSRWMWPALGGLLVFGIVIGDWWLIAGTGAALAFFLYQAVTLVRTLGQGRVATTTSRAIERDDADDDQPVWKAIAHIDGVRRRITVSCQDCIDALAGDRRLELAVLLDPDDADNHWLVGFREK